MNFSIRRAFLATLALSLVGIGSIATDAKSCDGPKASVTLAFQGRVAGKIEDCGCKKKPLGGLAHRAALLSDMAQLHDHVMPIDVGNLFSAEAEAREGQNHFLAAQTAEMGTRIIGIGANEVARGASFLHRTASEFGFEFVSSNLQGNGSPAFAASAVEQKGGVRIGFLSVVDPATPVSDGLEIIDPRDAILSQLPALQEQSDVVILLANLSRGEARRLMESLPADCGIDFVLDGASGDHFTKPQQVNGAQLLAANPSGKYMGQLDLTVSNGTLVGSSEYQLHPVAIDRDGDALMAQRVGDFLGRTAVATQ